MDNVVNDYDGDDRESTDPDEICILRNDKTSVPRWHSAAETGRTADAIDVENNDADDLGKPKRDDCKIVAAQAQTWDADDETRQRSRERTNDNHSKEDQGLCQRCSDNRRQRLFKTFRVVDGHKDG